MEAKANIRDIVVDCSHSASVINFEKIYNNEKCISTKGGKPH